MKQQNPNPKYSPTSSLTPQTLADHEKTVALVTDSAAQQGYSEFAGFLQVTYCTVSLSNIDLQILIIVFIE